MGTTYEHGRVYWAQVVEQKFGENKQGNPQFNITFKIMGMVDDWKPDGDLIRCPAFERTAFYPITEGTAEFVAEAVKRLAEAKGIAGEPLSSWGQLNPESSKFTHDFTGAELGFYCKHDTYQGKVSEKWSVARGAGGKRPEVDSIDDKKMRNLDALFGKHLTGGPAKKQSLAETIVPEKTRQRTAAATNLQAPPPDDGPAPWDQANAEVGAPADDIPF